MNISSASIEISSRSTLFEDCSVWASPSQFNQRRDQFSKEDLRFPFVQSPFSPARVRILHVPALLRLTAPFLAVGGNHFVHDTFRFAVSSRVQCYGHRVPRL